MEILARQECGYRAAGHAVKCLGQICQGRSPVAAHTVLLTTYYSGYSRAETGMHLCPRHLLGTPEGLSQKQVC
jgi:hypothetical protein